MSTFVGGKLKLKGGVDPTQLNKAGVKKKKKRAAAAAAAADAQAIVPVDGGDGGDQQVRMPPLHCLPLHCLLLDSATFYQLLCAAICCPGSLAACHLGTHPAACPHHTRTPLTLSLHLLCPLPAGRCRHRQSLRRGGHHQGRSGAGPSSRGRPPHRC
jgi:hypothetical protein